MVPQTPVRMASRRNHFRGRRYVRGGFGDPRDEGEGGRKGSNGAFECIRDLRYGCVTALWTEAGRRPVLANGLCKSGFGMEAKLLVFNSPTTVCRNILSLEAYNSAKRWKLELPDLE